MVPTTPHLDQPHRATGTRAVGLSHEQEIAMQLDYVDDATVDRESGVPASSMGRRRNVGVNLAVFVAAQGASASKRPWVVVAASEGQQLEALRSGIASLARRRGAPLVIRAARDGRRLFVRVPA